MDFSAIATLRTNLWLLPKPARTAGIRIELGEQDDADDVDDDDPLAGMDAEIEAALEGRGS